LFEEVLAARSAGDQGGRGSSTAAWRREGSGGSIAASRWAEFGPPCACRRFLWNRFGFGEVDTGV